MKLSFLIAKRSLTVVLLLASLVLRSSLALATDGSSDAIRLADGRVIFLGATLGDAIPFFNVRNRCQLVIVDPKIATQKIGGSFNVHEPERFARALEQLFDIGVQKDGEIIRLSSKRSTTARVAERCDTAGRAQCIRGERQ
jgi:ferric-dicitrate binding protein FerR (iron transport regulator)